MKKNFRMSLMATAILVSSIAGLVACNAEGLNGPNGVEGSVMTEKDVLALSAVSSVSYLSEGNDGAKSVNVRDRRYTALTAATSRPDNVADDDLKGIQSCIATFDSILSGGGIEQTVVENTATDTRFNGYEFAMTISLPVGSGALQGYTMYFNELETRTETECDDWEEEVEVRTTFEGVIVYGEELFVVKGVKEVETEGKETETSLEFRTYKNIGIDAVQADESNFVVVSQSMENDEIEYEYSFYENGRKVQEIELEYEEDRRGVEVSFQIKDVSSGKRQETEYELRKKDDGFAVEFEKNGKKDTITVTKVADGYKFVYSNGFEEVVK